MSVSADLASGRQELPRRVFAPLSGSGLSVCDYIFPDESAADVAERFKEMLGCDLSEGDVDTGTEAQSNLTYFMCFSVLVVRRLGTEDNFTGSLWYLFMVLVYTQHSSPLWQIRSEINRHHYVNFCHIYFLPSLEDSSNLIFKSLFITRPFDRISRNLMQLAVRIILSRSSLKVPKVCPLIHV